jgi:hypothetical protein
MRVPLQSPGLRLARTILRILWIAAAALCLHACAGVSVKGTWQDGAARNLTFARVLIVAVYHDYDLRCDLEYALASQLQSAATTVFSSCDSMSPKEPVTHANIERVIAAVHADAVLVTRLVSARFGERQGDTWDTRGDSQYKAIDFGYGPYGIPVTELEFETVPPLNIFTSSIHVVARLYQTSDGQLLYILDTTTRGQEIDSTQATLLSIAAPMGSRLRRAGLIR